MDIHYQDRNLIVTYLQVFLRENMGAVVHKVIPRSKSVKPYYEISSNELIKVTGYWTPQSYSALALYMAYNYPNEGFPYRWSRKEGVTDISWESEDYIYDGGDTSELVKIIGDNLDNYAYAKASSTKSDQFDLLYVSERVLAYIFNEVVTPSSAPSEIFRVKTMMYPTIYADDDHKYPLTYDEKLFNDIVKIQQDWIDRYTLSWNTEVVEYILQDSTDSIRLKPHMCKVVPQIYDEVVLSKDDSSRVSANYYQFVKNSQTLSLKLPSTQVVKLTIKGTDSSGAVSEEVYTLPVEGSQEVSPFTYDDSSSLNIVNLSKKYFEITEVIVSYEITSEYKIPTGQLKLSRTFTKGTKIYLKQTTFSDLNLTDEFKGFKVTGYVDPWTEKLIKRERGELEVGSNILDDLRKSQDSYRNFF